MIPTDVLKRMANLEGKLTEEEGRRLADLASAVPVEQAIVEVGSFKGKSACFLGVGSKLGEHAHIYAVDLWELHHWKKYSSPSVFAKWQEQIAAMELTDLVTPIRCESAVMGRLFSLRIGLLFIDGNHAYESVDEDFHAWASKVVPGGIVAFHDYGSRKYGKGVREFVDTHIAPAEEWTSSEVVDSMYIARRADESNGEASRLTFVSNKDLEVKLRQRPPQYAFDLSLIVSRRDSDGIYVDTHSAHYEALKSKYADESPPPQSLLSRVDAMCCSCAVGGMCAFPRLTRSRRQAVLESNDPATWQDWCETKAWGSEMDFVYAYVDGPARGDELRYSIRSVEKNFVGTPRIWVIGDKPDWYHGNHILCRRLSPRKHLPRFDRAAKLRRLLRVPAIANEFVWMMDDIYFLQPVTMHECRGRWKRAEMDLRRLARYRPKNIWQREKQMTWGALAKAGRPLDDINSHMPVVYEKHKLRRLFKKYKLRKNPFVDDLLYLNEFATYPARHRDEVLYVEAGQPSAETIRKRSCSALVMNHVDEAYTDEMQTVLREMFPQPSRCEQQGDKR